MGKSIKTETTAEMYMAEVVGPKIEAIEESIDSLKENLTTVLNTIKDDNASLFAKFEEMRSAKAQGRQFIYCDKEKVDTSIKESINSILNDNLIQRTINVQTNGTAHIDESDAEQIRTHISVFREWINSNVERQAAYEKSRRPLIHVTFTKKWFLAVIITILISSLSAIGYVHYNVRQTAESWADRSYKAGLELNEENPGSAYHEIMQDFQNGYDIEARQKVSDREIAGKERMKKIHQYENSINAYLQNVVPLGVTVINYLEESIQEGQTETLVFIKLNEYEDYLVASIQPDKKVSFTSDKRVTTIAKARKYSSDKIWFFNGNLTKPYTENEKK